jgi:hypothetical protein
MTTLSMIVFLWMGLVWESIPPMLQWQIKNGIRAILGRPPLPEPQLIPGAAAAGGAAGGGAAAAN